MTPKSISVPLRDDGAGGYRIADTRVTLDSVLFAHRRGESAEEIASNYDVLDLADVHAVITWALRHPEEAEAYLSRRLAEAKTARLQSEMLGIARTPAESEKFRQELLARLAQRNQQHVNDHASAAD